MGFDVGKSFTLSGLMKGGIAGSLLSGMMKGPKATPTPTVGSDATQTRDAATQAATAAMLARGLSPLGTTTPSGDLSTANIGKKTLLGQ